MPKLHINFAFGQLALKNMDIDLINIGIEVGIGIHVKSIGHGLA